MAEELKANQRKEWAKLMYLKENITQQEIADRVGCFPCHGKQMG